MGRHWQLSISLLHDHSRSILQLAFGDGSLRPVCARPVALPCRMHSVEHISIASRLEDLERSEAVALLRECRRILAPGGRLTVPVLSREAVIAGQAPERRCRWIGSADEWRELAAQVGLTHASGADSLHQAPHTRQAMLDLTKQPSSLSSARPLVSVLIPAFKHQFVGEAVESVLAQTYENLELVVCDDCPTDEIRKLTERYLAQDSRVRYFRNSSTLGSRENHIRCLELAMGEVIKFLSDDDRLHPACLERMVACLVALPDVTLVTSHRQCIDSAGRHLADFHATQRPVDEDSRTDGAALARAVLLQCVNMIGEPSTTAFRKQDLVGTKPDVFSLAGRRYESIGDVVMWLNLLSKGDAVYLADTLSYFRLHPDQEQRGELVRTTATQNWRRMQADANRLGLIPADAPIQIQWTSIGQRRLTAASERCVRGVHASQAQPEGGTQELDGDIGHWPATDQQVGGLVSVLGWVMTALPEAVDVRVSVDGSVWPSWVARLSASEIPPPASSPPHSNPFPGFHLMLDTRTIPDGAHVLTFEALCGRRTLILGERRVIVRNRDLLGAADGPAADLVAEVIREREAAMSDLGGRLDALARQRDAERLELEYRLDALARQRDADRLELESHLEAGARERDELQGRIAALHALERERKAERDQLARELDQATARLARMLQIWPVRLYGRLVRLPGAAGAIRRFAGVRR